MHIKRFLGQNRHCPYPLYYSEKSNYSKVKEDIYFHPEQTDPFDDSELG